MPKIIKKKKKGIGKAKTEKIDAENNQKEEKRHRNNQKQEKLMTRNKKQQIKKGFTPNKAGAKPFLKQFISANLNINTP